MTLASSLPAGPRLAPVLAMALLLGATGCDGRRTPSPTTGPGAGTPGASGTVSPARPTVNREVAQVVTADGELRFAGQPQALSFTIGGVLAEVAVTAGQEVEAGALIARVEPPANDLVLADARSSQAGARQQLDALGRGNDLEKARQEVERAKNSRWGAQAQRDAICGRVDMKPFPAATQADCDQAEANTNAAEQGVRIAEISLADLEAGRAADVAAARARLAAADAAVAKAQRDRAVETLTAPFAGTITQVNLAAGVNVAPGSPVVSLVQTRPLSFVTSNLGERFVGEVGPGDAARITLTTYPDEELRATVRRVDAQGTRDAAGAVVFTVYLDVTPPDGLALYGGMTGRVEIDVR